MSKTPEEVAPGVWRILLALPGDSLTVNVYAMRDLDGRLVLMDTGWKNLAYLDILDEGIRALGSRLEDIGQVIVTHGHPDHAGLAGKIQQIAECPVFLGRDDLPMVARSGSPHRMEEWRDAMESHGLEYPDIDADSIHQHMASGRRRGGPPPGMMPGMMDPEEPETRWDQPPDRVPGVDLEAVWTPGHSPGHACFYMASERVLFSGDHVLPHITPNVSLHPSDDPNHVVNPVGDFLDSLDKVRKLDCGIVLPAHGEPWNDLVARVDEILEHHDERVREMLTALDGGAQRNAAEIAGNVSWKPGPFNEMPYWTQRMAVGETLAHLRHLVVEQTIDEFTDDQGRIWFKLR